MTYYPEVQLPPPFWDSEEGYKMNNKIPNKDLLIRIDERTNNIWRVVEKIEIRQVEMEDKVARNTVWRKVIISVGGTIFALFASWFAKIQGLW